MNGLYRVMSAGIAKKVWGFFGDHFRIWIVFNLNRLIFVSHKFIIRPRLGSSMQLGPNNLRVDKLGSTSLLA
jgi:hypothetical protein